MSDALEVRREGDVLHLVLSAPERRNALSRAMLASLAEAVAAPGDGVRAIVLSGAGAAFSAGADLSELTGTPADAGWDDSLTHAVRAIAASPLSVIAAIHGPCVGAAVDLALGCDLRIGATDAFFEVPSVRLGLLYNPEAVARMHATVARSALTRLLQLGDRLYAGEALSLGLVDRLVADDPAGAALEMADRCGRATPAAGATKHLLRALDAGRYDAAEWQDERLRILASPERAAALGAAQSRHLDNHTPHER